MSEGAAKTGAGPTFLIAAEQYYSEEQRVINDDFAIKMLSPGLRTFVSLMRFPKMRQWMIKGSERDIPGMWAGMLIRKRYIDEKLRDSVPNMSAVVNLGAGADSRFFRIPELKNIPVWELDQSAIISSKGSQIAKALTVFPKNLFLTPIDFDHDSIADVLSSKGYPKNAMTFFIWEGVTQYLTQEGIESVFDFLSNAEAGSKLAFTYVLKDFIQGKVMYDWEKAYEKYVLKDKIWVYGINPDELPSVLEKYGWRLIEDKSSADLADSYIKPTGRTLKTTPIERICVAEKV
ncbi:leucine carboxyl methyltransferase [Oxobacter pfennigii]|uniref:S-adenosyl-L-methionine-dependent methyltransferase n=1 Tax=Oxobacter pfennigii TaxID=36849 RepID=A0A0N8NU10_9CLOT|nr:SAM-dependent methyltransferase [Oxobacter pfennigii]KPU46328.1 leucine carboxyl methyltransferase [Oxobacter pfennigii]